MLRYQVLVAHEVKNFNSETKAIAFVEKCKKNKQKFVYLKREEDGSIKAVDSFVGEREKDKNEIFKN